MPDYEDILRHWYLLRAYQKHKIKLVGLATQSYLTLCVMNQGLGSITIPQYHQFFAKKLAGHPLFKVTIMEHENPYTPPWLYSMLSHYLARYIIANHWYEITSFPC